MLTGQVINHLILVLRRKRELCTEIVRTTPYGDVKNLLRRSPFLRLHSVIPSNQSCRVTDDLDDLYAR